MTQEVFYDATNQALGLMLDNLDKIVIISQACLILICGLVLYELFWRRRP